ncbi:MAG: hypothetical protein ACREJ2_19235 [Planctomycetota bacterium]
MRKPFGRIEMRACAWLAGLLLAAAPAFAYTTLAPRPDGDVPHDNQVWFGIEFGVGSGRSYFAAARSSSATMTRLNFNDDFRSSDAIGNIIPSFHVVMGRYFHFETSALLQFDQQSSATLSRTVTFDNQVFPSGNRVRAKDDFYAWNFDFLYGVIEDPRNGSFRLGAGFVVQGARSALKDLTAGSPEVSESLTVVLPEVVAEGELVLDPRWVRLYARAEAGGLDNGYNFGATAGVLLRPDRHFEFSFHLRAYTAGVMDPNSYTHYNNYLGAGIQFIWSV